MATNVSPGPGASFPGKSGTNDVAGSGLSWSGISGSAMSGTANLRRGCSKLRVSNALYEITRAKRRSRSQRY